MSLEKLLYKLGTLANVKREELIRYIREIERRKESRIYGRIIEEIYGSRMSNNLEVLEGLVRDTLEYTNRIFTLVEKLEELKSELVRQYGEDLGKEAWKAYIRKIVPAVYDEALGILRDTSKLIRHAVNGGYWDQHSGKDMRYRLIKEKELLERPMFSIGVLIEYISGVLDYLKETLGETTNEEFITKDMIERLAEHYATRVLSYAEKPGVLDIIGQRYTLQI